MLKDILKFYKNFPKEGINFVDIIPFLQSKESMREITAALDRVVTAPNVIAPEARAFLFATPLLCTDGVVEDVVPLRKSGKLPYNEGDLVEVKITKEYGFDTLFYRLSDLCTCRANSDTIYITLLDDVLATGGTAEGVARSLESRTITKNGKEYRIKIKEFVFLVGIPEIHGTERLEKIAPVHCLMEI
ncbi:MAG: hypothetical protein KBS95_05955 [Alistipes sp.]|nr:hypothetical protein [Candidatus Alistipes equi]